MTYKKNLQVDKERKQQVKLMQAKPLKDQQVVLFVIYS
jgi:hypothetical protein